MSSHAVIMVKADDLASKGPGFDSHRQILDGCNPFVPNVTRLTFNRLKRLMVGRQKNLKTVVCQFIFLVRFAFCTFSFFPSYPTLVS